MLYKVIWSSLLQPGDVILFHGEDRTVEQVERAGTGWTVTLRGGTSATFGTTAAVLETAQEKPPVSGPDLARA